jgi:YVTN family beta-propeller protein
MRALILLLLMASTASAAYEHFEGRQVHPLSITPDGTRLIATDTSNAKVTIFDLSSGTPIKSMQIPVGLEPVTVNARTNDEIWVVNEVSDSVSIISLSAGVVVETLKVGDEPTDVVFAAGKAYVACARAGQIRVFDASTKAALTTLTVNGIYPHALAANADGTRLYAAFLLSGNRTTILKKELAPNQPPPTNSALPNPPKTALIVPANDSRVSRIILDHDVVEIDTGTNSILRYISDLGTNLFDLAVRPGSDEVWVSNTEALNLIPFEPNLRGHFADNRLSVITSGGVTILDLNPGMNYSQQPNPGAQASALAQPTSVVFTSTGSTAWMAAFASDRLAMIDASTGEIRARVDLRIGEDTNASAMRGPRGLVLDEARGKLYSLNKISSTLSVIDTTTLQVSSEMALSDYDPMPANIREGRGYLFDARLSGNGTVSCGTCHMDADRDGLAWDLGDPGGDMLTVLGANLSVHDTTPRPRVMHPMKGPMVTQTLRGMQNGAPFHWRGDKPTLQSFNPTFDKLMGGAEIEASDMDNLADYLKSLVHHSNPNRNLDRSLPTSFKGGNAVTGRTIFIDHNKSHCTTCHAGLEGTDHNIDLPQEAGLSQPVKNPPLRTSYQRLLFDSRNSSTALSGFGLLHDGTGGNASLPTVHPYVLDNLTTSQELADISAFIHCFDTGTAPTVGYSRTVRVANRSETALLSDLGILEARANAGDCDLIVRGKIGGVNKALLWNGTSYRQETQAAGTVTRSVLLANLTSDDAITFMGVLRDAGDRLSIDEDEDTVLNGDDPEPGIINGPPQIITHPQNLAVAPGAAAELRVEAEGTDLSYQWKLGSSNVGTNSPVYRIAAAALADAGLYRVVVSNTYGNIPSNEARLSVVPPPVITRQPIAITANEGANVTLSVTATGSNLSYQWRYGSTNIGGANKAELTLGGVAEANIGEYSVVISNGDTSVTSETVTLTVRLKPVMNDLNLPRAMVGQRYEWQVTARNSPTQFKISGLPAGLSYNASTGVISGRLTTAKTYTVKASASNAIGSSPSKEQLLTVERFHLQTQGTYRGFVPRDENATFGNNLGGRISLTSTSTGSFSGTLLLGSSSHSFKGSLTVFPDADPTGKVFIKRSKMPALELSFRLHRSSRDVEVTLKQEDQTLTFPAHLPAANPANYAGNYTFAMKLATNDLEETLNPAGYSVGAFKVSSTGIASGIIRLADGSSTLTFSGVVGDGGSVPIYTLLYSKTGSLLGQLKINQADNSSLSGSAVSWFKHPQRSDRSYPQGFGPLNLQTIGRKYIIPLIGSPPLSLSVIAEADQASLRFSNGGVPNPEQRLDWASLEIQPGSPAKILPPESNPGLVKITITPGSGTTFTAGKTGSFSGSFILKDTDTSVTPNKDLLRSTTFTGMIVDDGNGRKGYGFFNLAEMPTASPKTTSSTTQRLSGQVEIRATTP